MNTKKAKKILRSAIPIFCFMLLTATLTVSSFADEPVLTPVIVQDATTPTGITGAILSLFDTLGNWFPTLFTKLIPIFWDASANSGAGALTILGTLSIITLSISVCFLFLGLIQRFLHLRA